MTLTANPSSVVTGGTATLTWSSANTTSCTASGGWSGAQAVTGSASTGALITDTSYTLTCSGPGGATPTTAVVVKGRRGERSLRPPTRLAPGATWDRQSPWTNRVVGTAMTGQTDWRQPPT